MPLLDYFIGEDDNNPPEAVVPQLEEDRYYRWLTWVTVPLHFVALIGCAWWVGTQDLAWWAVRVLAYVAGTDSGPGHQHRPRAGPQAHPLEQWLARLVLAVPAYGHFTVEHGRGHHRWVSTPRGPRQCAHGREHLPLRAARVARAASAAPGHWSASGCRAEPHALEPAQHHAAVLRHHRGCCRALVAFFGWMMLPFLAVHNLVAWWQLTSANYVEHYGLLRQRLPDGQYERRSRTTRGTPTTW